MKVDEFESSESIRSISRRSRSQPTYVGISVRFKAVFDGPKKIISEAPFYSKLTSWFAS
jgi:hypothetical protein